MKEIKRYSFSEELAYIVESATGDLVGYEHYAALQAENESNLKSAQYSAETNRKISLKNGELYDQLQAIKEERDALAAESARMRIAIDRTIGWQESVDAENTESVRSLHELDTPATNAYLNSVRAEGIQMLLNKYAPHTIASSEASDFAAQLRAGKDGE